MKLFKIIGVLLILSVATVSQGDPSCTCLYEESSGSAQYIAYEISGLGAESCCGPNMGNFSGWIIQCGSSGCDFFTISGSGGWTCMLVACCFESPNCVPQS